MALRLDLAAIPLKLVAFPVVAGLAAGTGALAAYVTTPAAPAPLKEPAAVVAALPATPVSVAPAAATDQMTPAKSIKKPSCTEQTWPYIDNRCIARKGGEAARDVRLVVAPRDDDGSVASGKGPKLITSDGVLRGPGVAPEADTPKAKAPVPAVKKSARRSEARQRPQRNEFRRIYSVYSVPAADSTKPVIVVRPMNIEQYSSRF
jgi:hypothetical protein